MSLDDEVKELKPPQQTVAATLVATVTLAAGFILPGGYWAQEGPIPSTPILRKNAAFQAFVIANAMAMVLSLLAVFYPFPYFN
ncbi:hypothetical protein CICLE_v10007173mg [Citrus x clementina]|uniref:PGG domain-containing protein n=1 Tax=Citrus clementina TaxID=85681 RepID=V4U292_CITCL|nr:hypothetical protein CICLE_v10007173mg [Citrus x clementina]